MSVSPARRAAYDCLLRIDRDAAFSSIVLPEYEARLNDKDRRLCHQLVLGVLRRQMLLDAIIDLFASGKKIDPEVRIILRLGLFQLKFLDKIPDHSAVNDSVSLTIKAKKISAKGFVNALLRRSTREEFVPPGDGLDRVSIEESHPKWLLEHWAAQFGVERAISIAKANNQPSKSAYRVTKKGRELGISEPDDPIEAAKAGHIYFQEEASQMVARAVEIPEGGRFLDVCAAPGSKTSLVADLFEGNSSLIVAGDRHFSRIANLAVNCRNQGLANINAVQYDATAELPFAEVEFDSVLVDAPCSGTGTIRSNPEIRYSVEQSDFEELQTKQLSILKNASKMVRRGGELYYSTCSIEREENETVILNFLNETDGFESLEPNVSEQYLTDKGFARTFPDRDDMDGFFIARLKRS